MLFVSIGASAQPYLTVTADLRNGITGSEPTNNEKQLDIIAKAGVVAYSGALKNVKVGIIYERFNVLDFTKHCAELGYDFKNLNLHGELWIRNTKLFDFSKLDFQASAEGGWIQRYEVNFWTYGANLDVIYFLNDNLGVVFYYNFSKASDTDGIWNEKGNFRNNVSIGFTWRFDEYQARY